MNQSTTSADSATSQRAAPSSALIGFFRHHGAWARGDFGDDR